MGVTSAAAPGGTRPGRLERAGRVAEKVVECSLWESRRLVLVAVVASLVVALGTLLVATVDVVHLLGQFVSYATAEPGEEVRYQLRTAVVGRIVEVIDGYLVATVMLIFAFGLYELFISRIDAAEGSEMAPRILLIRNLDDLKDRLAKLVLLILVVRFFEHALRLQATNALELLYLSIGIALIAAALYLTHKAGAHDRPDNG